MKQKVFAIFDAKAGAFLTPFFMHNEKMSQRVFADCVMNEQHAFSKHPEDYILFMIGEYDDETAELKPLQLGVPTQIISGLQVVSQMEAQRQVPNGEDGSGIGAVMRRGME